MEVQRKVTLVLVWGLWAGPAWGAPADSTRAYHVPRYEVVDTTQVQRGEVTLAEIIRRCTEGESRKLHGHTDLSYTVQIRTLLVWDDKREIEEGTYLAYEEDTGFARWVLLDETSTLLKLRDGEWVPEEPEGEAPIQVSVEDGEARMFTEMPIFLEQVNDFHFELTDRKLLEDRVIFEIRFKPKSSFKPLPAGTVYVDTRAYQIVHEIYTFGEQNPFPLLLKGIERFSRQWKQAEDGTWVTHRLAAEFSLRTMMGLIPGKASVAIQFEDYRFDQGYDPRRFGAR